MLTCSLRADGLCGLPATTVLILQECGSAAEAFPRCSIHGAAGYEGLIARLYPGAVTAVLPVPLPVRS